jgi:hypothetical protein
VKNTTEQLDSLLTAFRQLAITTEVDGIVRKAGSTEFTASIPLMHYDIESSARATCKFILYPDSQENMPKVFCTEYWVKRDVDWHIYSTGELCYDLPERWKRNMKRFQKRLTSAQLTEVAANWCLIHSQSLLFRHLFAYDNNLEKWPQEWKAFRHGKAGLNDYLRRIRTSNKSH